MLIYGYIDKTSWDATSWDWMSRDKTSLGQNIPGTKRTTPGQDNERDKILRDKTSRDETSFCNIYKSNIFHEVNNFIPFKLAGESYSDWAEIFSFSSLNYLKILDFIHFFILHCWKVINNLVILFLTILYRALREVMFLDKVISCSLISQDFIYLYFLLKYNIIPYISFTLPTREKSQCLHFFFIVHIRTFFHCNRPLFNVLGRFCPWGHFVPLDV